MPNENCLEGIICPKCGQEDEFKITALITCLVNDDGSEPMGDHEWDDESRCECVSCEFSGKLKDFKAPLVIRFLDNEINKSDGFFAKLIGRVYGMNNEEIIDRGKDEGVSVKCPEFGWFRAWEARFERFQMLRK